MDQPENGHDHEQGHHEHGHDHGHEHGHHEHGHEQSGQQQASTATGERTWEQRRRTAESGRSEGGERHSSAWSGAFGDFQEMVGDFVEGVRGMGAGLSSRFPRMDLVHAPDEFRVLIDVPGMAREEIQVAAVGDELAISGRRTRPELPEDSEVRRSEREYGRFHRTLRLPHEADPERVSARLEGGVLELRIPRRTDAQAREIEIG